MNASEIQKLAREFDKRADTAGAIHGRLVHDAWYEAATMLRTLYSDNRRKANEARKPANTAKIFERNRKKLLT